MAIIDHLAIVFIACLLVLACMLFSVHAADPVAVTTATPKLNFPETVRPIFESKCFSCHANQAKEGQFSFDELLVETDAKRRIAGWQRMLKQLRADMMPPRQEEQPSNEEVDRIVRWIKFDALGLDAANPDPGRVTIKRLNRTEYRNTIRDLLGVDFDTNAYFPADDTGHGFDNIGDVLSISPLLMEKYVDAATEIVKRAVPTSSAVIQRNRISGGKFKLDPKQAQPDAPPPNAPQPATGRGNRFGAGQGPSGMRPQDENKPLELSYYAVNTARYPLSVEHEGNYVLELAVRANENYVDNQFDLNKCQLTFSIDGTEVLNQEFVRQGGKQYLFSFKQTWQPGDHELVATVTPLTKEPQIRNLRLGLESITLVGPHDPARFVKPERYDRFFPASIPGEQSARIAYARELLAPFARRAFRGNADQEVVGRLVAIAMQSAQSGKPFEEGIASAMTAVIASPRFLFREESTVPGESGTYPLIDEFSLASRLSYMLWATMPDDQLLELAEKNQLRNNLDAQVDRMLADKKSQAFYENFVGQWLEVRAVETIPVNARAVQRREQKPDPAAEARRRRYFELLRKGDDRTKEENEEFEASQKEFRSQFARGPRAELTGEVRRAMKREVEMMLEHVVHNNLSVLDLLNGRYTFLNEALSRHYEIEGIQGTEMRRVDLPPDSKRGGVLTTGAFLTVTSNPDRTSPVKRGLYILENILGTPTGAPPPNVPALDEGNAGRPFEPPKHTLRESLAIHRKDPLCSSCHNRMDPLGLAFENFNALGRFRSEEIGQPIDPTGTLVTGESFQDVNELKQILATSRKSDFYRCLTEKLLTYALGRAIEYEDVQTVDGIVDGMESTDGSSMALLRGVIHSNAFQRTRQLNGPVN